jgi:hypothetical protein
MAAQSGCDVPVNMLSHADAVGPSQWGVQLPGGALCQILAGADVQSVGVVQQRRMVPALRLQIRESGGTCCRAS